MEGVGSILCMWPLGSCLVYNLYQIKVLRWGLQLYSPFNLYFVLTDRVRFLFAGYPPNLIYNQFI